MKKLEMGSFSNQVMVDITFFCSPIGLGHAARDSAIVQHLKEIPIKFVTGDAAAKFLKQLEFNVEDVYIPPQFVIKNGLLQNSLRWLWKYYKYYKDCKDISSSIIKNEKPQVIVSDEDFASLTVAQEQNLSSVLITDVLETRFTKGIGSIIERKMNRSMKDIMKKCDVIIGGTDAGKFLIEKTIESYTKIKNDVELVIVSGPSLKKDYGENIRNLGFVNNLHEIIFASDLI